VFERSEAVFKILCAGLAALVLWQVVRALERSDPLAGASIPALPSLPGSTNLQAGAMGGKEGMLLPGTTNIPARAKGTNVNSEAPKAEIRTTTNIAAQAEGTHALAEGTARGTNAAPKKVSAQGTNVVAQATNTVARSANAVTRENHRGTEAQRGTNAVARGTNAVAQGTNAVAQATNVVAQGTNASVPPPGPLESRKSTRSGRGPAMMNAGPFPGMPGMPGMPGQGPPLPPAVQARLDRIIESEILAPVMRPQPVALLGIVDRDAFLQAPNGQSGLLKEGEEMGGIKLLRLGINRALIEEAGEKKELTLFSGLGSESLLSKQTNSP